MIDLSQVPQWFFGYDEIHIPSWFHGYDSIIQLALFIITLFISAYAFKIYTVSRKKESYFLAAGFFFVSVSYFLWAILNLELVSSIGEAICRTIIICHTDLFNDIATYFHMLFKMLGILTLSYITLKSRNWRVYSLLLITMVFVIIFAIEAAFFFYLLCSILLFYLALHHVTNYLKKKQKRALFMSIAFILWLFGNISFIFGLTEGLYYVIGISLAFVSYIIIFANLILSIRK